MSKLPSIHTQQLLEENELKYQLLIESVKDYAIFMLDPKGYIITWNSGANKLNGYTKEEAIGQHFSIFYPEEALKINHPAHELKVARETGKFEEEGWRIKKDGSKFWANVVISAIYDSDNKLTGFSKVTRDLTEQKKLQNELQKSEERSRLLIASVKDYAIFLLTPEGKIASWNEGAKKIKGYEAQEIIGCHFSRFYPPDAVASHYPNFELVEAMDKGRFEDEGWRIKKDGSKFWANVVITPIYSEQNQHIGFTKVTRDLSDRVRNEELMRKNAELHKVNTDLDNFVYSASHDLKSPIANLEGLLQLVESKISPKLDKHDRQIVAKMGTSIARLQSTIDSLVEVTKAQKNLEEPVEIVSFKEILEEVKEDLASSISSAKVDIKEELQVEELSFAKASLRCIMYNLLSNAIKYHSPKRKPEVKVRTYKSDGQIILCIKDNGLGLSQAHQAKLFGMFKRFHRHVEGSGVGLYIVKRTVENYGGRIEVRSKLNEGTLFRLYFDN
ncbi:PAS domain S-box-containing protein [Catalinimonas alkaloidigena]|uniref:sensor histidine kinase n=1 Tax=Catalinimonas alkaloidigena TaxID=1075417 RepID=UPI0024061A64|nr:PAS domain-containing sensor histidine kinase [Catalinimonas alkaloidigena]MDF9800827.1 PAS domain S-box-containing protein [Catalinimonas alkaloidigena]